MTRNARAQIARVTLDILKLGHYTAPSGTRVELSADLERCKRETRLYLPHELEALLERVPSAQFQTQIEVTGETTLEAAHRLAVTEGEPRVCALNFASAKNPGGGFLGGSQAQEESLARSSGLYPCLLRTEAFYAHHRRERSLLYSDQMIYSPAVPVLRDDAGTLLERPYALDFLTSPAPNAGALRTNQPHLLNQVRPTLERRAALLLALALERGMEVLILGAWGCGVFQNDPRAVAEVFQAHLNGTFADRFRRVVFAVYDRSSGQEVLGAFRGIAVSS